MGNVTVGSQVFYYPHSGDGDAAVRCNGAEKLPAIVIQDFGRCKNLQVFTMNPDAPNVLRYSVSPKDENIKGAAYWSEE